VVIFGGEIAEIVAASGVQRCTRAEAETLLGVQRVNSDGLMFRHFYPPLNGHDLTHPIQYRFRQDHPPIENGKVIEKYLTSPGAQHPFFVRGIPIEWYADKSVPALITEGPKQAMACQAWCLRVGRKMIAVGINGCYGWSGKTGIVANENGEREPTKGLLPLLEEVCRDRRVLILYDSDEATNMMVRSGRNGLAQTLTAISPSIKFAHLPPSIQEPHRGPDDFLASYTDEQFAEVFEEMEPYRPGMVTEIVEHVADPAVIADMPADCMSGGLGEIYEKYMGGKFPRAHGYTALLAGASALVQERAPGVRTNINIVKVGPSGSGKSQSDKWARGLLGVWDTNIIDAMCGSAEQFAAIYGDAGGATRLFAPDEAGAFLEKCLIEHSSYPYAFIKLFDNDLYSLTTNKAKKTEKHAIHMHLSFVGGLVDVNFEKVFTSTSVGGFYQRCLFTLSPSSFPYFYRPFPRELQGVEFRVPSAIEVHADVYEQLGEWANADPDFQDNRHLYQICLRCSIIAAAFDGKEVLTVGDLKPFRAMIEYQRRVRAVLQPSVGTTLDAQYCNTLLRFMEKRKGEGFTIRNLLTATNGYRYGPGIAERVIRSLIRMKVLGETPGKRKDSKLISYVSEVKAV
jgi:hypothetical protein